MFLQVSAEGKARAAAASPEVNRAATGRPTAERAA
jgi:hypothetical protein